MAADADKVYCNNCEWKGDFNEMSKPLGEMPDLSERLEPGEETPAGECPECGAFCYLENPADYTAAAQIKAIEKATGEAAAKIKDAAPFRRIFIVVDGGNVQDIYGPADIEEVVMIDHDNGEADEETRLENEEKEVLLKHHLACKRIESLY